MTIPFFLAFAHPALAAVTVLYAGDPSVAVEHVASDAAIHPWEIHPVRISELLPPGTAAIAVGAGQVAPCMSTRVTNAGLRDMLALGEKKLLKQDDTAAAQFAIAAAAISCLSEPAEASLAGRVFFLQGVNAQELGHDDDARKSFGRALAFQPELVWDDHFAPEGKGVFDAARAAIAGSATGPVLLGPGLTAGTRISIDGHAVPAATELALSAGVHLVQTMDAPVATMDVDVQPGRAAVLMVPSAFDDRALAQADLGTAYWQTVLGAIFDQSLGDGAVVYTWNGSRVWKTGAPWVEFPPSRSARSAALGRGLASGGIAALVAGGAGAAVGWLQIAAIAGQEPLPEGEPELYLQRGRLSELMPWTVSATGVAGLGGIALLVGSVMQGTESAPAVSVLPLLGPSREAGLALVWRD